MVSGHFFTRKIDPIPSIQSIAVIGQVTAALRFWSWDLPCASAENSAGRLWNRSSSATEGSWGTKIPTRGFLKRRENKKNVGRNGLDQAKYGEFWSWNYAFHESMNQGQSGLYENSSMVIIFATWNRARFPTIIALSFISSSGATPGTPTSAALGRVTRAHDGLNWTRVWWLSHAFNPFLLILNVPLILKTGIHLQFPKISVWPIWLLIDPL